MDQEWRNALPVGAEVDACRIERVLGAGGFGITYLATDLRLDRRVAVKEYLPTSLAERAPDGRTVRPLNTGSEETYKFGLDRFQAEAQTLARFSHPNIVGVQRFFEANGTAYLVMPYEEGLSLAEIIERHGALSEDELREILDPLLDGLEKVHAAGFLHRDIKPGNIYIRRDGTPVLLDFGAARQALSERSQSLTIIATPGYAPFEQYSKRGNQGPWTDIYALGATLYRAITGVMPPDAPTRLHGEELVPATEAAVGPYGREFLEAVDAALALQPEDRPQSVGAWRAMLASNRREGRPAPAQATLQAGAPAVPDLDGAVSGAAGAAVTANVTAPHRRRRRAIWAAAVLLLASAAVGGTFGYRAYESAQEEAQRDRDAEARRQAEAQRRAEAAALADRRAAAARKKAEQAEERRRAEAARKKAAEEEARRRAAQRAKEEWDEAQRRAIRRREAEEAKRKAAEETRRKAEEARKAEAERLRREEARREAERRRKLEQERSKAAAEAERKAKQEARRKEAEAKRKAEQVARKREQASAAEKRPATDPEQAERSRTRNIVQPSWFSAKNRRGGAYFAFGSQALTVSGRRALAAAARTATSTQAAIKLMCSYDLLEAASARDGRRLAISRCAVARQAVVRSGLSARAVTTALIGNGKGPAYRRAIAILTPPKPKADEPKDKKQPPKTAGRTPGNAGKPGFDGRWVISYGGGCGQLSDIQSDTVVISGGRMLGNRMRGTVTPSGAWRGTGTEFGPYRVASLSGQLRGNRGSGRWETPFCSGAVSLRKR